VLFVAVFIRVGTISHLAPVHVCVVNLYCIGMQAACDAEKEGRKAAELAANEVRAELERSLRSNTTQLQSVSAAADRRAASAAADIALLERALEATAEAQREADHESRDLLAVTSGRERASADRAQALEAQVRFMPRLADFLLLLLLLLLQKFFLTMQLSAEKRRSSELEAALATLRARLSSTEKVADQLPLLQSTVSSLQSRVSELQAEGERRDDEAAEELRLVEAQVRICWDAPAQAPAQVACGNGS
jgi:hypothetical protein